MLETGNGEALEQGTNPHGSCHGLTMTSMPFLFHLEERDDENAGGIRPGIPHLPNADKDRI
ncbi:MAG: hypothetical protein AAFY05_26900 [Pseudomonadota bacterium]